MSDPDPASSPTGRSNSDTPAPRAFKPRAGIQRRTKAEREKFAKEEAEREAKRVKDAAKTAGAGTASTRGGRATRGRGAAAQNDTRLRSGGEGGGVFGAGTGERPTTRTKGSLGVGNDELIEGSGATKALEGVKAKTSAAAKSKKHVVVEGPKDQESADPVLPTKVVETEIEIDEEPDEPRRDIERIWISSDDEQTKEDTSGKGKERASSRSLRAAGGLRPVRAPRTFREDEQDVTARAKTVARPPKKPGAEPIDVDEMDADEPEFIKEVPSSPELKRKNIKKPAGKAKDVKFATETPEERTERLRVAEDTRALRSTFTPENQIKTQTHDPPLPAGDGKLFLLQFPPLTPLLIDLNAPQEQDEDTVEVKQESTTASATDKGKAPTMKKDLDGPGKKPPPKPMDPHNHNGVFAACCPPDRLASGLVGKLNVHASGKITLDWGGTDMEVRLGTEVDFLQDAVLVQTKDEEDSTPSASRGTPVVPNDGDANESKAFALGQVQGKMVLIPDWSKLYD